jgi:hypothetical protein
MCCLTWPIRNAQIGTLLSLNLARQGDPKMSANKLDLTSEEQAIVEKSLAAIKDVLAKKKITIANKIGLVTAKDVEDSKSAVEVRLATEIVTKVMNMVAFD